MRNVSNYFPKPFQKTEEKLVLYEKRITDLESELFRLKQSHLEVMIFFYLLR